MRYRKGKATKILIEPLNLRRIKEQVPRLASADRANYLLDMSDTQQEVYEKEKSMIRNSINEKY
jgi:hypothetical protein